MGDNARKSAALLQPLWRGNRLRCYEEQRVGSEPGFRFRDF